MAKTSLPETRRMKGKAFPLIFLGAFIVLAVSASVFPIASGLRGQVLDEHGDPAVGAEVSLWFGRGLKASGVVDQEGYFDLEAELGPEARVLVFSDDPSTPGVDHIPHWVEASRFQGDGPVVVLEPAASLVMEGDIQFVESEGLPESTRFSVLDPVSGRVEEIGGLPLIFGSTQDGQSHFLGLEPNHLVVPVGKPFLVGVNCSLFIDLEMETRSFDVDGFLPRTAGEMITLDSRPHSIRYNLEMTSGLLGDIEEKLDEMDVFGFYLVRERGSARMAHGWLSDSLGYLEDGRYVESFDSCKMGYIELAQTQEHLESMLMDAATSVHVILAFLALTSTAIAFLIFNRGVAKVCGSIAAYAFFSIVLYYVYPGSVTVPTTRYIGTGVVAMLSSMVIASGFPSLMKGRGVRGRVPIRNIVVPIFSIAKRGVRRRRLRFLLTLSSISVLVMSFVALTSISESYGLLISDVRGRGAPVRGLLLRAPGQTEFEKSFFTQREAGSGWVERQQGVISASYKAENVPLMEPITRLNGVPINGVMGFDPQKESAIFDFGPMLKEGSLPSEGGVVVSEGLRQALGARLGESLSLGGRTVRLEGVFDDSQLLGMKDLDGSPYLPSKLVNVNPAADLPDYRLMLCEPQEVVVTHLEAALGMPLIRIARVNVLVEEDVDVNSFGERLALERGYWAWSASDDGVVFSRLGSYTEGRGFPLVVPWCIVVLNVVVTMTNSMYDRRKEISILSSVGLNPAHIATIFVAEALIMGLIGGGIGYLGGMSLYRGMDLLGAGLEVEQKISALWSVASLGVAMVTILMAALVALKSSVVITPSLQRRWRMEEEPTNLIGPWEIRIPVKLLNSEVDAFTRFVLRSLRALEKDPYKRTSSIKVAEGGGGVEARIDFIYKAARTAAGELYTRNTFIVYIDPEGEVVVTLSSRGTRRWSHEVGSLMRMITMRWSTLRDELTRG